MLLVVLSAAASRPAPDPPLKAPALHITWGRREVPPRPSLCSSPSRCKQHVATSNPDLLHGAVNPPATCPLSGGDVV